MPEILDIEDLILQYLKGELTEEGKEKLQSWISQSVENRLMFDRFTDKKVLRAELLNYRKYTTEETSAELKRLEAQLGPASGIGGIKNKISWQRYTVAAAVLIFVFGATFLLIFKNRVTDEITQKTVSTGQSKNSILPGREKARLVLDDGTIILLDSAKNGELAIQGNTAVVNDNGRLTYQSNLQNHSGKVLYNLLETQRGEMYETALSDGSKVWINAQSALRFPVAFSGKERVVELKGEAYFEVSPNPGKPFKVFVEGKTVEVLGTDFSIKAYRDEQFLKTSLIEGKVKVSAKQKKQILLPGQQLLVDQNENFTLRDNLEIQGEIAWTRGYFYFDNEHLYTIMRTISRWYSVDVEYHEVQPMGVFAGHISRKIPLADVLNNISGMVPVSFEIVDGKVHVYPK